MKNKELQIARDNASIIMAGKFSLSPEKLLHKTIHLMFQGLMKKKWTK